jgi:CheY-like chemotaxis protein
LIKSSAPALSEEGRLDISVRGNHVLFRVNDPIPEDLSRDLDILLESWNSSNDIRISRIGSVDDGPGDNQNREVYSEYPEGEGITIALSLPRDRHAQEWVEPTADRGRRLKLRILVVDDMAPVVSMLKDGLTEFGQTVYTALSGSDALHIFREEPVDVIICDLSMPGMNGWEVGKAVKRTCEERGIHKIPFIILTGWGGQVKDNKRIIESGVDEIVEKPIDVPDLLDIVRAVLNRESTTGLVEKQAGDFQARKRT